VDLNLRGNDSAKNSKYLKLLTCTSISMHMKEDVEILRYGFCLEYGILSNAWEFFQTSKRFKSYRCIFNSNLLKLIKKKTQIFVISFQKL
jgi:hypothetical protein